ncbi:MAG: hypothetical protein JXA03_05065 [Bacteroidales bacterium]|nr:hypothetical protein [Bacteroidales bacterium]
MRSVYVFFLSIVPFVLDGQICSPYVVANAGNYSGNATASLSWTLGETITETFSDGTHVLTQGFQQPVAVSISGIILDLMVFLEGPYEALEMATDLNSGGNIPLSQPYNTAPWNYAGTEAVASMPSADVVDWILVELRDAPDAASAGSAAIVAQQAAFLLKDGSIVGTDGSALPLFNCSPVNSLFAVLWHRNHLGIMSANPLIEAGGVYSYDFTAGPAQVYGGSNAHKELAPGIWGMIGADGNADSQVNNGDKNDVWATQAGTGGYLSGDFNLDAQVNNGDKNDVWIPNTGLGGQVPDSGYKCQIPQ